MADGELGAALQGDQEPAQAAGQWDDWLQRPGNRTALLQMGLQLMQPVALGQTVAGHIAQGVGAGAEAVGRADDADLKERVAQAKMDNADARVAAAQTSANAATTRAQAAITRANSRNIGGLTDVVKARFARQDQQNFERQLDKDAGAIVKQVADAKLLDPQNPIIQQYDGLSRDQVREKLRATRKPPQYGAVPSNQDNSDDSTDDFGDTGVAGGLSTTDAAPPVAGAKLAPDGNWYVPDPKRPGKYARVTQ